MPTSAEKKLTAGRGGYEVIMQKLTNERGVHAETAIACAGRMAGTFMLRSCRLPMDHLEPGMPVLSDAANEKGPYLTDLLQMALTQMNININPNCGEDVLAGRDAPQISVLETQRLLENDFRQIMRKYQLNDEEASHAATFTTAFMVQACGGVIEPQSAFQYAIYSMVEGSKTVPQRLAADANGEAKKPWYKVW
ncbi:MAG: hypothetical protein ACKV2V_18940 [Blastocatellia bacterium]